MARYNYRRDLWTGEMFAQVLLDKEEYKEHPMLKPYRQDGERGDNPYANFYWDYYSQGKPCYVKMEYPGLEQIVDIIHRNGGCAVLAHPGVNLKDNIGLLRLLIEEGMDGIEAFSSYHSRDQALRFCKEAVDCGLFYTCGSDFHGKTKPSIEVGQHGCRVSDEEVLGQLGSLI